MKKPLLKTYSINAAGKAGMLIQGKPFPGMMFLIILLASFLVGCESLRPSRPVPVGNQSGAFKAPTPLPTITNAQIPESNGTLQPPQIADCTNDLIFLDDLSIPDGTQLAPGKAVDKEWQVRNSGTCNWNEGYTVRLISGPNLGAAESLALVPARNGNEAVIRIQITAPSEPGRYTSTWRAFDPFEKPFGEWFSVEIVVTSP